MTAATSPLSKRFNDVLPESIAWLPHRSVEELLGISESQRRKDTAIMQALTPKGWTYTTYSKGYHRAAVEVLWEFRQLAAAMGRTEAIALINQTMETLHREHQG